MENDVYRHMRGVAEGYKARTGRDFWEDLRSEARRSYNPDWIKRYFEGKEGMA